MDSKKFLRIATPFVTFGLLELAHCFKLTALFGLEGSSISGFTALGPIAGAFTGTGFFIGFLFLHRLIKTVFVGGGFAFTMYLPTIAGSLYWQDTSRLVRLYLPVFCLLAFVMHPVGAQAFVYALYWLIPISLYFLPRQTVFTTALGATFTQHAVGSVMWLYMFPIAPQQWYALMPVVAVERLLFASILTIAYYGLRATLRLTLSLRHTLATT